MKRPWLEEKKETLPEVLAIIKNARVNGCWVYRQSTKEFFTPEEFELVADRIVRESRKENNFADFRIVSPMFAIRLCTKWADIANMKLQDVMKKTETYNSEFKPK